MSKLITQVQEIQSADTADLVNTYNKLTGKTIKRFENRAIAERRVEMALLAAKDADGKTGVKKGEEPQSRTREEIVEKATSKGQEPPSALDQEEPVFQPGTMAYELAKAAAAAKPIEKRERRKRGERPEPKAPLHAVIATFAGTSKPQAGSVRNSVLQHIQGCAKHACTIEALDAKFKCNTRGYVQKLLEKNHLRSVTQEELAAHLAAD